MSVQELLCNINREDKTVPLAVEKALPQIEILVSQVVDKMKNGVIILYRCWNLRSQALSMLPNVRLLWSTI
jgi:N-acetylmuramic acid 6-phosphate (MurNAc-6-P) etherase